MDTTTYPALVVPDVSFTIDSMLSDPSNIRIKEDIGNAVMIIDNIIEHLEKKEKNANWLYAVREFSHEDKVNWILSLPDASHQLLKEDSFIFPVKQCVTMMVKVAETESGEPLYEKRKLEITLEKCIPSHS